MLLLLFSFTSFQGMSQTNSQVWFPIKKDNKKWCYVSTENGSILNNQEFDSVTSFAGNSVAKVMVKSKWGLINTSGKMILPIEYVAIQLDESNQTISLWKDKSTKTGLCNFEGKFIDPFNYESCTLTSNRLSDYTENFPEVSYIHIDNKPLFIGKLNSSSYEVISKKGIVLLDASKTQARPESKICYYLNDEKIVGSYTLQQGFNNHHLYPESKLLGESVQHKLLYALTTSQGISIVDHNGVELLPGASFDVVSHIQPFIYINDSGQFSSVLKVQKGNQQGIVDENGKYLLPLEYASIEVSVDALLCSKSREYLKYDTRLNKSASFPTGNFFSYDRVLRDYDRTKAGGKTGVSKTDGNQIIENKWDNIFATNFTQPQFIAKNFSRVSETPNGSNGELAVYDSNGKLLFERKTDLIRQINQYLAVVESSDKTELILLNSGKTIGSCPTPPVPKDFVPHSGLTKPDNLAHYRFNNDVLMFRTNSEWLALDSIGNIINRFKLNDFDQAEAVYNSANALVIHYFSTDKENQLLNIESTSIPLKSARVEYNTSDRLIYVYTHDSLKLFALSGTNVFTLSRQNGNSINHISEITHTDLKSMYVLKKENKYTFLNDNFKALTTNTFDRIQVTQNNVIGFNNGNQTLLIQNGRFEPTKSYQSIDTIGELFICNSEMGIDIYTTSGKLLYSNCQNIIQYSDYFTFQKENQQYWMTTLGKTYSLN